MGGHALKKVVASRIRLSQYNKVKSKLYEQLSSKIILEFLIDVPNKIDFGDIDILYQPTDGVDIVNIIKETFNPVEIVSNGDVCSFSYQITEDDEKIKYFQVDLIKSLNLKMCKFYFSYGDLGGIIGQIAQYIGLKYGSAGLWVCPSSQTISEFLNMEQNAKLVDCLRTKFKTQLNCDNVVFDMITKAQYSSIVLTSNPKIICEYFGLDYNLWVNGFMSKDDIYEWVIKSKFFNSSRFKVLDHAGRQRANKRPVYQDFLRHIFKNEPNFTIEKAKEDNYLNLQLEAIKQFYKLGELDNMIIQVVNNLIRKHKFNGSKLIRLGIVDKQIPICIKEFKKKIGFNSNFNSTDEFNNWLDLNDLATIDQMLKDFVSEYKMT